MRKTFILSCLLILSFVSTAIAADYKSLTWAQVCAGNMGTAWYASDEAKDVADIVLSVQKTNGGWMKNDQLHKLTSSELATLKNARGEHSCLDNYATTQEMRFLAKVYQGTKEEKYREAFIKALNMIFAAEFANGGWGQYWPLSDDKWSYQNYITFNDDLVTNVLKMLRDVNEAKGDFQGMADDALRTKCMQSFNKGIEMIIKCQIDDNGTKAAWCAQHDPADLLPTEGRPHELPSVSGFESANLLSFLMTIPDPSKELQECITSAVKWLDEHKIADKAIEDFTNSNGEKDRRVIDKAGSAIWGRFIQIGGESGKTVYEKLFKKLKDRGKKRSYRTYTYTEEEIARASYDASKAYEPIYAIYDESLQHLYYRFLYNYADSDPITDSKGCQIITSLNPIRRTSYQFLGSWCQRVINDEYPAWKRKIEAKEEAKDATLYELSTETSLSSKDDPSPYNFSNGFSISNAKGKGYGTGIAGSNTIKYSANDYTINIPNGLQIVKIKFYGYNNYTDADAYLKKVGGQTFATTDYVFPAKNGENPVYKEFTIDLSSNPAVNTLVFALAIKQCCLTISVYCTEATGVESIISNTIFAMPTKTLHNGQVVISKNGKKYNVAGVEVK